MLSSSPVIDGISESAAGLISGFIESAGRYPNRDALVVAGNEHFTYAELQDRAASIAAAIAECSRPDVPLAALLADRSISAYSGCLGILGAGKGYVPLNRKLPAARLLHLLERSNVDTLVAGNECLSVLEPLLEHVQRPLTIVLPDSLPGALGSRARHRLVFKNELPTRHALQPVCVDSDALAYLLFTSGSTGEPKAVGVTHKNVQAYLRTMAEMYQIDEHDRFSQYFDMSFDLSVHDMFCCWYRGACLYSVPPSSIMAPAKFIQKHNLTVWFSVPSAIGFMLSMNLLKPGCFPSLRYSLFCGEALSATYADAWQRSAPESSVDNLYGPTEATIAITRYRWIPGHSHGSSINGIVPIGNVLLGHQASVRDADLNSVPRGQVGELCLSGPQVTPGYCGDPERTRLQFVTLGPEDSTVWYRTGDLVRQDETGCLHYLGRLDSQVKICGHRVELEEIECILRLASKTGNATAVAWPVNEGVAQGIVGFVATTDSFHEHSLITHCQEKLPPYMVPARVFRLDRMPLTLNGKIDRSALISFLESKAISRTNSLS